VTRPFPEGGSKDAARWAPGAPPVAPPPQKLATVAARPARTLVFDGPVASLAADGARAVAYSTSNCGGVTVWNGATGARRRTPRLCDRDAHLGELALAGRRLAWISYFGSNTGLYQNLWELAPGARKPGHLAFALAYEDGGGDELSGLVGSGATLAFTSTDVRSGSVRLWRVAARRAAHCPETASEESTGSANRCVRLRAGDGAGPTSVDRGRIAAVGRDRVVVVGSDGRLVRALAVPGASAAAIAGDRVAVQAGPSVAVYSVSTGARVAARSLTRTGTPPALLGLRGDVAIYVSGAAVHLLRLSTGRDVALTVPGLAPPVTARLTGAGLFLLYNRLYARSPGRLAFVPFRAATP
jgi:hypothetical protein